MVNISLDVNNCNNFSAGIGRYSINILKHLLNHNKYNYTQITGPKTNKKLISSNHEIINCNIKSSFLRSYSLSFLLSKRINVHHSFCNDSILFKKK
jgi:hypothetical protein